MIAPPLVWICPRCRAPLVTHDEALRCERDGFESRPVEGIRDFLRSEDRARVSPFVRQYQEVRRAEGRGSDAPRFYLDLPSGGPGREWKLRTRGLDWLRGAVGARSMGRALDAGAGCCWLTRHLAQWGYQPVALDLNDDARDGLGAGRHYARQLGLRFERVLAPFERLPFADASFDLVVFNASFHYAADQAALLAEAVRVTRPGQPIVILDSPVFRDRRSGEQMVRETARAGFIAEEDLIGLGQRLGLEVRSDRAPPRLATRLLQRATELRLGRETATLSRLVLRAR